MTAQAIRRDKSMGLTASVIFHFLLLTAGGLALSKPAEYAVDAGSGGIEINLTAAPAEVVPDAAVAVQEAPETAVETPVAEPDEMRLPQNDIEEKKIEPVRPPEPLKQANTAETPYKGDGSSAVPGRDAATFYSSAGAVTEAKPHYLKNPAPSYPREAREKGWEGVVVLKVLVDKDGRPASLENAKGSGYDILDRSAMTTVKKWKFRPARLGSMNVESTVFVPIRFELEGAHAKRS